MKKRNNRDEEVKLYEKAYQSPDYKMGVRRKADAQRIVSQLERGTLLDVGCGRGELVKIANELGHKARGLDPVAALKQKNVDTGMAHEMPYADNSFDHVVCFDVLEHLVEEDIIPVLKEMQRVARKTCIVSASEDTSIHDGVDLHISRRPASAWFTVIKRAWGQHAKKFGNAGRSPCFRLDLKGQ